MRIGRTALDTSSLMVNYNKSQQQMIKTPLLYSTNKNKIINNGEKILNTTNQNDKKNGIKNFFKYLFNCCNPKKEKDVESFQSNEQYIIEQNQNTTTPKSLKSLPEVIYFGNEDEDSEFETPIERSSDLSHRPKFFDEFAFLHPSLLSTPVSEFQPSSYDFVLESYKARHNG